MPDDPTTEAMSPPTGVPKEELASAVLDQKAVTTPTTSRPPPVGGTLEEPMVVIRYTPINESGGSDTSIDIGVPEAQHVRCLRLLKAIGVASYAARQAGKKLEARKIVLVSEVPARKRTVQLLKLATLGCGIVLMFSLVPAPYTTVVAVILTAIAASDFAFGKHKAYVDALEELHAANATLDVVSEPRLREKMSDVIAKIAVSPEQAGDALEAFLQYLQSAAKDINDGTIDIRKRLEKRELEFAERLALPQPTAALTVEAKTVK